MSGRKIDIYNHVMPRAVADRMRELAPGKGDMLKDINFFLESFGQNNREFKERTNDGDITQAILLMNSPFVLRQVKAQPGSYLAKLLDSKVADELAISQLFERFLVRQPTREEMAWAKDLLATGGRRAYEDLQWLLINKVEFVFNY